jgi:hypothetical protein
MRARHGMPRHARTLSSVVVALLMLCTATASAATTKWSVVSIANPGGTNQSFLDAVSCRTVRTTTTCVAVGSFVSIKGVVLPLIERWNGKRWVVSKGPVKKGAIASTLVGVSCASPTSCIAVGSVRASLKSPTLPLAERWNGRAWKIIPIRAPSDATHSYLDAVSCTSAKSCYAVGSYASGSTMGSPLVERWNGSRWTIMSSPNASGASTTALNGVSCVGAGAGVTCAAVGSYATRPEGNPFYAVTQRMVHGKWTALPSPKVGNDQSNALTAVSCAGPKRCFAAGTRQSGLGAGLIEQWNGSAWKVASSANPVGSTLSQFNGISCASRTNCVATGLFSKDFVTNKSLINRWNGRRWAMQPSEQPSRAAGSSLSGVSCTTVGRCFAVGTYLTSKFANPPAGFSTHHS